MGLRVGFDASVTLLPERRGIARYTMELLKALVATRPADVELVVLLNSLRHRAGDEHAFLREAPGVTLVERRVPGPALLAAWGRGLPPGWETLTGQRCDVVHAAASYIPPASCPVVATVFDLGFLRDEGPGERHGGAWFRRAYPRLLPRTAAIVTPSRHVAADVAATYPAVADRITAVHLGIDTAVFQPVARPDDIARLAAVGMAAPYILAVTDTNPRKRPALVPAVAHALATKGVAVPVVAVGHGAAPLAGVRCLPWVDDATLAALYRHAAVVLLTSREEGFGFPLLEAMACGAPVVAGRHSSLAEIGGTFANWAMEETAEGFARAVVATIGAGAPAGAASHAASFTWGACARATLAVYRQTATCAGGP